MGYGNFLVIARQRQTVTNFFEEIGGDANPSMTATDHQLGDGRIGVLVSTDCGFSYDCTSCGKEKCPGCGSGGVFDEDVQTMICGWCSGEVPAVTLARLKI